MKRRMTEWFKIEDSTPEPGRLVAVLDEDERKEGILVFPEFNGWIAKGRYDSRYLRTSTVTHWRSLSVPPEAPGPQYQVFDIDALKALIRETITEMAESGEIEIAAMAYI